MAESTTTTTAAALRQGLSPCARDAGEGTLVLLEDEAVHATFRGVRLMVGGCAGGDAAGAPAGELVVTTRRVAWLPADPSAQALAASFLDIDMHAVQGGTDDGPGPCVYLQLSTGGGDGDGGGDGGANGHGDGDDGSDDDDTSSSPPGGEVRLVPADAADVDAIFGAMCECAALNPDPAGPGGGDDDDQDGGLFFDRDAAAAGAAAARLDALLVDDPARFEDPPDEGEGGEA